MSEHSHNVDTILLGVTKENIEVKLATHTKELIKTIEFFGFTNIKISSKITKASNKDIHIQSLLEGE